MKICVDMDSTICKEKLNGEDYYSLEPVEDAVEILKTLKEKGYYIVIHTARGMKTYNNNHGKIIAAHSTSLIEWLKKWEIPFDEILFGKPHVECYIDDKGYRFDNWKNTYKFLINLEKNNV